MTTKKKTPKPSLTIVAAYRRLNDIVNSYNSSTVSSEETKRAIDALADECKAADIPFNLSISTEDLEETGINPTPEASYVDSYEPEASDSY
jgi:hypothetical protein